MSHNPSKKGRKEMKIIKNEEEQNEIQVVEERSTFDNGDTISSIWLEAHGTRIEISVQNWDCGHKTSPTITIHEMRDSIIKVFEKTNKRTKKLLKAHCYVSTITSKDIEEVEE